MGVARRSALGASLLFTASVAAKSEPTPEPANAAAQRTSESEAEEDEASPESERVILLVRTSGDDEIMGRLRAELADSDWRIVELRVDERLEHSPLARLARKEAVSAAVRLDSAKGVVELWISNASGDIEETIGNAGERSSNSELALGATEALRARGLFLNRNQTETPEPPTPAPTPRAAASTAPVKTPRHPAKRSVLQLPSLRPRRWLWLELAPAAAASRSGLGATFQALVGTRVELDGTWSLGALGLVPLTTQEVSGIEGSARVSTFIFAGVAEAVLLRTSRIELSSGVGLGATISSMRGSPLPGYRAEDVSVGASTAFARGSLQIRLNETWRLAARALLGGTLPEVSIRFEDREVATWGRPFFVASLGLEVPLLDLAQ